MKLEELFAIMPYTNSPPQKLELEVDTRVKIADEIRAQLVCCDIYAVAHDKPLHDLGSHTMCFWGEQAARIADGHDV
jgi:hypothetical protein